MSEFQYAKVSACVWRDRGFRGLSVDGKLVWMYVLTCPGLRSFGAMFATVPGMAAELGMELGRFELAWGEVLGSGMVRFDGEAGLVVVPKFLRHNPPASPNVVRSWKKAWVLLPECGLLDEYLQEVRAFAEGFGEGFGKAFLEAFGEGNGDPLPNLITHNSDLNKSKNPPISPLGGEQVDRGQWTGVSEEEVCHGDTGGAGSDAGRAGGREKAGERESGRLEVGKGGEDSPQRHRGHGGGEAGSGEEGGLRQDAAATEGAGEEAGEGEDEGPVEVARVRRGKRSRDSGGVDPLLGHPVLREALGAFRERLVGVHGPRASLGRVEEEGRVLLRLAAAGFEERDVVAILKWVLWEEPEPLRPGGFCWRDQFRSIGGLVKPLRSGEMKFKGMAAGYEAWARAQGGVAAQRPGAEQGGKRFNHGDTGGPPPDGRDVGPRVRFRMVAG